MVYRTVSARKSELSIAKYIRMLIAKLLSNCSIIILEQKNMSTDMEKQIWKIPPLTRDSEDQYYV